MSYGYALLFVNGNSIAHWLTGTRSSEQVRWLYFIHELVLQELDTFCQLSSPLGRGQSDNGVNNLVAVRSVVRFLLSYILILKWTIFFINSLCFIFYNIR